MADFWEPLRVHTQARIGQPRVGDVVGLSEVLKLRTAHAFARDAVHEPLDTTALSRALPGSLLVRSRAADRGEYLRRPDLGRLPADLDDLPTGPFDLALVVADGLSTRAVGDHAPAMVAALHDVFDGRLVLSPPIIASQARVAIGDHIGERLQAGMSLVLIGERPGLSVADSLGIYLTFGPRPGRRDSERNCVSNIHPHGLSYGAAARTVAALVDGARKLGASGVRLKDVSSALPS